MAAVNGAGGGTADMWSRGTKRGADDSNLTDLERFEKRLRSLSIRNNATPKKDASKPSPTTHHPAPPPPTPVIHPSTPHLHQHQHASPSSASTSDMMSIDPTPNHIFIHDLDAELADLEDDDPSSSEKLIFLPDIEAKLSKLPPQILNGNTNDSDHQELVLYSVPKSLTVDESRDSVRKAIIEARQRARERVVEEEEERRAGDMGRRYGSGLLDFHVGAETAHGYGSGYGEDEEGEEEDGDPDAMDLG